MSVRARPWPSFLLLPLLAFVTSCASVETDTKVRDMPPAALTIAVADATGVPESNGQEGLRFAASPDEFRTLLVTALRDMDAASRVVSLRELADPTEADIVVKPTVDGGSVQFAHEGATGSWWAAAGLWLVTWIGGLAVDDSSYTAKMAVDCTFVNLRTGKEMVRPARSDAVNTSFLERNDFFSWPTLQSFVLPPFWTSDQTLETSKALTERAIRNVAADISAYLKVDFEGASFDTDSFQITLEPRNGVVVDAASVDLRGTALSKVELADLQVQLGASAPAAARLTPTETSIAGTRSYAWQARIDGLSPGSNWIRILARTSDGRQGYARTVRVTRRSDG